MLSKKLSNVSIMFSSPGSAADRVSLPTASLPHCKADKQTDIDRRTLRLVTKRFSERDSLPAMVRTIVRGEKCILARHIAKKGELRVAVTRYIILTR